MFLPHFGEFINDKLVYKMISTDTIIKKLYINIKNAIEKEKDGIRNDTFLKTKSDIFESALFQSRYVSTKIHKFIDSKFTIQMSGPAPLPIKYHYKTKIGAREIDIVFILFKEEKNIDTWFNLVVSWLMVLDKYSPHKCIKRLKIHFLMTPLKKELPELQSATLSADNCNSAVTTSCPSDGEILIYRQEEWFKVFIHETFHAYGLDFIDQQLCGKIKKIFPINSNCNINDSYAEFWATIIHNIYISYMLLTDKNNIDTLCLYVDFCIKMEQIFSLFQCVKVLSFMGLDYESLYNNDDISRKFLYKEKTNVFSYYILKCLLLNKYEIFLKLCNKGKNILDFKNVTHFFEFVKKHYNDNLFLEDLKKVKRLYKTPPPFLQNTMRMTILEMF